MWPDLRKGVISHKTQFFYCFSNYHHSAIVQARVINFGIKLHPSFSYTNLTFEALGFFLNSGSPTEGIKRLIFDIAQCFCVCHAHMGSGRGSKLWMIEEYLPQVWLLSTSLTLTPTLTLSLSHSLQVDFYISQSQAANHAVREAACSCIAELGTKVCSPFSFKTSYSIQQLLKCTSTNKMLFLVAFVLQVSKDCLRPHISKLVTVLLECFKDDSWPVRDGWLGFGLHLINLVSIFLLIFTAACLACGNFVACFPEECRYFVSIYEYDNYVQDNNVCWHKAPDMYCSHKHSLTKINTLA